MDFRKRFSGIETTDTYEYRCCRDGSLRSNQKSNLKDNSLKPN